jgi:hypothetical protein
VLCACLAGLVACGENADQKAAEGTVTRFYEALKRHDATTACGLLAPQLAEAMLRAAGEHDTACVAGLRRLFTSPGSQVLNSVPKVESALVNGDRAVVDISKGYEKRQVALRRIGDHWQITAAPALG